MATTGAVLCNANSADGALTGWTNPTYAYADDTNFATRTGTTKSQWYGTLYGFDLSTIPDGSSITSVTLTARVKYSANDSAGPEFLLSSKYNGVVDAGTTDTTGTTSEESVTYTPTGLTTANLKATGANGFWAVARFRRTDNTAHTASLDYITCAVVYVVVYALTSKDIATPAPTIQKPTLAQKHVLASKNITAASSIAKPTITQKHVLTSKAITASSAIAKPTLTINLVADDLTGKDISFGISTIQKSVITQKHALLSKDISDLPLIEKPNFSQKHALISKDITSQSIIDRPVISQNNAIISKNIIFTATIDKPFITQVHGLSARDLLFSVIIFGKPNLLSNILRTSSTKKYIKKQINAPIKVYNNSVFNSENIKNAMPKEDAIITVKGNNYVHLHK